MSGESALDLLCDLYGITPSYRDADGQEHHATSAARRALLRALGVTAGDAATERDSLEQALDRTWQRMLPPVVVIWGDADGLALPVTLPERTRIDAIEWRLHEEGGDLRRGPLQTAATEPSGETRVIDGAPWQKLRVTLPRPHGIGWHRLELHATPEGRRLAVTTLIVAPTRCYECDGLSDGGTAWGLATQLDTLRSARNWGIGDFTDLTRLVELVAERGGSALAIPPLHAHLAARPGERDPGRPASRLLLDVMHIDVEAVPELGECEQARTEIERNELQARLRALRAAPVLDHAAVAQAKLDVLRRLYRHFRRHHLVAGSARAEAFRRFRKAEGEPVEQHALLEVLASRSSETTGDPLGEGLRADSKEAARLAGEQADEIDFYVWLQWQARQQLAAVGRRSLELHLPIGLCPALAAGTAPHGTEVWANPDLFITAARPAVAPEGGDPQARMAPGLSWNPIALRDAAYVPFARLLRANMRDAGALRIQQIGCLVRQFLVPQGLADEDGAYLSYPLEDLLGVIALESQRQRCLVIGEETGRIPQAVSGALERIGALTMRFLFCEQTPDGGLLPPSDFPRQSAVALGNEDQPTLAGFWRGSDLEHRRSLHLFAGDRDYEEHLVRRSRERAQLFLALGREGLLPEGDTIDPVAVPKLTADHRRAVHLYLARAPARLLLIQAVDLLGQIDPVMLPGSGSAYPNWRQRQPLELERWRDRSEILELLAAVGEVRRGPHPAPAATEAPVELALARIPRATYRLQLHGGFGFAAAAELVPYLSKLGISHCYLSPYFRARPGSTHGYDVVAHDQLSPDLGSPEDYERLCAVLAAHDMSQILDVVPNHVGVMGAENPWWLDVLENGPASPFSAYFDIDWRPLKPELQGKLLVPVLGDHYGNVLDSGILKLVFAEGAFRIEYYEHHFPIDPREYPRILAPELPRLRERLGETHPDLGAFESLVTAFGNLPPRSRLDEQGLVERRRDKELHKQRLAELCAANADLAWYLQECVSRINGADSYPPDLGRLHDLLEAQAYRLAHWRVAADDINYRRFFDINDLAALRMEHPDALEDTHRLVLDLIAKGLISGLRIDHPDGLYDPAAYFRWIQRRAAAAQRASHGSGRPLYLVVEKILMGDESLPTDWPVHGTTGYDFAALTDALFVDARGAGLMTRCYQDFTGDTVTLEHKIYEAKHLVMRNLLSSELQVLATELARIAEADLHTRDYTLSSLRDALREIVACFPVYRTYIASSQVSSRDRNQVLKAVAEARRRSRAADLSVFDLVRDVLLGDIALGKPLPFQEQALRLAMKLQQYTGPVTAKGVEDTAFYRYHRLTSLNEVGQDAGRFGVAVDGYHRANRQRYERWPHALLAGSTHDAKRSEDVRSRLHVLSEVGEAWRAHAARWSRLHRRFRRQIEGQIVPDPPTEYLLYQTLLGAWPLQDPANDDDRQVLRDRFRAYMEKAAKEAKIHTSWTNPDSDYESAIAAFTDAVLDRDRNAAFFEDFLPFQRRIARLGLYNSLSQVLLRLTAPGVPDIYQGCELWSFSLVDPDNRRPVDFARRAAQLDEIQAADSGDPQQLSALTSALLSSLDDGRAKLYLIQRALELRRQDPQLFEQGDYVPLKTQGPHSERLCSFSRSFENRSVIVLVPRHLARLTFADDALDTDVIDPFSHQGWSSTFIEVEVAADQVEDPLCGGRLTTTAGPDGPRLCAADILRRFPVGLLTHVGPEHGQA